MIGNITIANNTQELSAIIQTRLNTKVRDYRKNGMEAPKCKVIVVDDYCNEYNQDDYITAPILLPDSKSMECLVFGQMDQFEYLYRYKLMNDPDIKEYLIVLVAGLMEKQFDYIFYFDTANNTNLAPIESVLMNFLREAIGLTFRTAGEVIQNPQLLYEQSMLVEFYQSNLMAVSQWGYNVKSTNGLFRNF